MDLSKEEIIRILELEPLEPEGGFFARVYESQTRIDVPFGINGDSLIRPTMSSIYYMVTADTFSAFHKLKSTECYHFYMGARLEVFLIYPDGTAKAVTLGTDLRSGDRPQLAVEPGVWQASRLLPSEKRNWCLVGTNVAPGFEFDDFEMGKRDELVRQFPQHAGIIHSLTRG